MVLPCISRALDTEGLPYTPKSVSLLLPNLKAGKSIARKPGARKQGAAWETGMGTAWNRGNFFTVTGLRTWQRSMFEQGSA